MAGTLDSPIFRNQSPPGGLLSQRNALAPADSVTDVSLFDANKTGPLDSPAIQANPPPADVIQGVDASPPDAVPPFKITGAIVPRGVPFDLSTAPLGSTLPAVNAAKPDEGNVVVSALRQGNPIVSTFANREVRDGAPDPDFNSIEDVIGTKYQPYANRFAAGAFNRQQSAALKAQIDMEEADQRTLAAGGVGGVIASLGAGLLDPTNLLPLGEFYTGTKLGKNAAAAAARVGLGFGAASTISELALQATQETRTPETSAFAIGGSILAGALLGGAASPIARSISSATRNRVAAGLARLSNSAAPDVAAETAAVEGKTFSAARTALPGSAEATRLAEAADAGAAAVERPTLEGQAIAGDAARYTAEQTAFMNPNLRMATSPSAEVRAIGERLTDLPLYRNKNFEGVASPQDVETLMRETTHGRYADALESHNQAFGDYRKAGGTLTFDQFSEEVGRAMARDDKSEIPQAAQSAQAWRSKLYDPPKDEAIGLKMLPEDVKVTEAPSYFNRLPLGRKIEAEEPQFRGVVQPWVEDTVKTRVDQLTKNRDMRVAALNQHIADIEATPEARAQLLKDLPEQRKALDQANPQHVETDRTLAPLREQEFATRTAGGPQATALRGQIKDIVDKAGSDYADYVSKRNLLQSRLRRLKDNIVGREDKVEQLRQRIADEENANVDRLWRMHQSVTNLISEAEKGSPEAITAELTKLRTDFAKVQERSARSSDRIAAARTAREGEARAAAEAGDTVKAAAIEEELKRPDPFVAEAKREEQMNVLAERIGDLEKTDPEEALNEFRDLIEKRISMASETVENAARNIDRLAGRLKAADPKIAQAKAAELRKRIGDANRKYEDTVDIKLDGQNDFQSYVKDIVDHIVDQYTGRSKMAGAYAMSPVTRGPLAARTLHIPDKLIEPWLERNVVIAARRYAHVMASDINLTRNFGSPDLKDALARVAADYDKQRAAITGPDAERQRLTLSDKQRADVRDITQLRDLIRGTANVEENNKGYSRALAAAGVFTYLVHLGGMLGSALNDPFRIVMTQGLGRFMNDGIRPLVTMLKEIGPSIKDAKLAGAITETVSHGRLASMSSITDPFTNRSPFEKFLENAARGFTRMTGITYWDDMMKTITSTISQTRTLEAVRNYAAVSRDERARLALLGIDEAAAGRIAKQFELHGETRGGVHIANTEKWGSVEEPGSSAAAQAIIARRQYRAALNKDVSTVTPVAYSAGDKPLIAHTPIGRALFSFQSFTLASHQRMMLRGLQEQPANVISALMGASAAGMLISYLKAVEANKVDTLSDNPGHWMVEGLDRSGMVPLFFTVNNVVERSLGLGAYGAAQSLFPGKSQKENRSLAGIAGSVLGPTGDFADGLQKVLQGISAAASPNKKKPDQTKGMSAAEIRAIRNLIPGGSLPVIRSILDYGIEPMAERDLSNAPARTATVH